MGALFTFASGALGMLYGGVDGGLSNDTMSLECQGTSGRATARDATAEFRLWTLKSKLDILNDTLKDENNYAMPRFNVALRGLRVAAP